MPAPRATVPTAVVALALAAAAFLATAVPVRAQVTPPDSVRPRPDTVAVPIPRPPSVVPMPGDSAAGRDTTARDRVLPPLAAAPRPAALGIGGDYLWDRDAILASGAVTLTDLLERVPGITTYRTGWLVTPEHANYAGAFGRMRIFYDGVELDQLDPRTGEAWDLARVELWTLEEVAVERGAGELRIRLRSWRVSHSTPYSRFDATTGEYGTNLFRGLFGQRYGGGQALQLGFQQFATRASAVGGDGDEFSLFARLGWAKASWSVDAFAQRNNRLQNSQRRRFERADLPALETRTQLAYVRGAYRSAEQQGPWAQVIVSTQSFDEKTEFATARQFGIPADSADTTRTRLQYVGQVGWTAGPLQLAASARVRAFDDSMLVSPSARAAFFTRFVQAQVRGERAAQDSTLRLDGELRLTPTSRLALSIAAAQYEPDAETGRESERSIRGEAGVRVGRTWLVGGAMQRDGGTSGAPIVFDPAFAEAELGQARAVYGGLRGPIYRQVSIDLLATQWIDPPSAQRYRPEQQLRAQLVLDTRWLSRFPRGEFGLKAAGTADYRSIVGFPTDGGELLTTRSTTILTGLVELRIQNAVIFLQARNFLALQYEYVPGFLMPRNLVTYGVRWQFWN